MKDDYAKSLLVEPAYKVPIFLNVSAYLRVKGLGSSCTKRMLVLRSGQKKGGWGTFSERQRNEAPFLLDHHLTFGPDPIVHEGPGQETCSGGSDEVCGMFGRDSELQKGNG